MAALIKIDHSFTSRVDGHPGTLRFCSRCGEPAEDPPREQDRRRSQRRVCDGCGMGLLLRCSREALPGAGAAFMVVTVDLEVTAVSLAGEDVFGDESEVLGMSVLDLVTSPLGDERFARTVGQAGMRSRAPVVMPLRGLGGKAERLGTLAARISTCGPPRAALVTVEPSGFGVPR
jgi:hypothetical protein